MTRFEQHIKNTPTLNWETFKVCRCCEMPAPRLRRVCRSCGVPAIWDKPTPEQREIVKAKADSINALIAELMKEIAVN